MKKDISEMKEYMVEIKDTLSSILQVLQDKSSLSEYEPANDNSEFEFGEDIARRDMQMHHDKDDDDYEEEGEESF